MPVRYAVEGEGSPVVLIHGLAGSWNWWRRNIPALRERFTVYLIDLPGFGGMRAYRNEFSIEHAPEWLQSLLAALEVKRPSVIGHSMGGGISLAYAARWPDDVDKLVLVAPAVGLPHKTVFGSLVPLLVATGHMAPRFYPTLVWDAVRCGPRMVLQTAKKLVSMAEAADAQQVKAPVLLVWGRNDTLVPLKTGEGLRSAIPQSRLHIIERAGHVPMFERSGEFNDVVLRFLSGEAVGT